MADISKNIYWLSDGRWNLAQVLFYLYYLISTKNGMEMFVHCFIEENLFFLNTSTQTEVILLSLATSRSCLG